MAMFSKFFVIIIAAVVTLPVVAQPKSQQVDFGKHEFQSRCASCHGASARGNGPMASQLKAAPPDLTVLAKNNGGVLPVSRLYDVINGTGVPAHGSRDMPVWGQIYGAQAGEYILDSGYDRESFVRARILALIDYINRLQAK